MYYVKYWATARARVNAFHLRLSLRLRACVCGGAHMGTRQYTFVPPDREWRERITVYTVYIVVG